MPLSDVFGVKLFSMSREWLTLDKEQTHFANLSKNQNFAKSHQNLGLTDF